MLRLEFFFFFFKESFNLAIASTLDDNFLLSDQDASQLVFGVSEN